MKALIIIILVSFSVKDAKALLPFEDAVAPELITSARALAMGNAYISKVDDSWAAFYNPAGLGSVRKLQFHLTNLHLELNNGFTEVAGRGSLSETYSNYVDAFQPDSLRTKHAEEPGNLSHAKVQAFPNLTYRGITIGYMYSKQHRARLKSLSDDFELAERTDWGPVISMSASLFGGIIKFGATGIYLTRRELQKDFAGTDVVDIDASEDYTQGSMTHLTAGARITLPYWGLPTFSGVIRNSSNVEFDTEDFSGLPNKIPQTVEYGASLTPIFSRTFRTHFEVVAKDVGNRFEDVPNNRKVMGGIEFDYMRLLFVRLGFGDGWGSGGIGVRDENFIFDLTTYAIEASDDGYREEEDRRTALSISAGF